MKKLLFLFMLCYTSISFASTALVISNSASSISMTAANNATTDLISLGYDVEQINDSLSNAANPRTLTSYVQIWDFRYNIDTTLDNAAYLGYLQSGGALYLSGEAESYSLNKARNDAILALINAAGGGAISVLDNYNPNSPNTLENVSLSIRTPNPLTRINYNGCGDATSSGTGDFLTTNSLIPGRGCALGFIRGSLSKATGLLTVVFDVSFAIDSPSPAGLQLLENLMEYMGSPTITKNAKIRFEFNPDDIAIGDTTNMVIYVANPSLNPVTNSEFSYVLPPHLSFDINVSPVVNCLIGNITVSDTKFLSNKVIHVNPLKTTASVGESCEITLKLLPTTMEGIFDPKLFTGVYDVLKNTNSVSSPANIASSLASAINKPLVVTAPRVIPVNNALILLILSLLMVALSYRYYRKV